MHSRNRAWCYSTSMKENPIEFSTCSTTEPSSHQIIQHVSYWQGSVCLGKKKKVPVYVLLKKSIFAFTRKKNKNLILSFSKMNVRQSLQAIPVFPFFAQRALAAVQVTPQCHRDHLWGERCPILCQTIPLHQRLPVKMLLDNFKLLFRFTYPH